ncbi:MAG: HlyD family efflux transporter periplasmic adaptor subunit [Patescibacteria group bacterium]
MNKKNIIGVIFLILFFFIGQKISQKKEEPFAVIQVSRGNIVQEISEVGQVKRGEGINLGFQSSGKIQTIFVKVGESVQKNNVLAKLDMGQLEIQLEDARASLVLYQSKLDKLLAGSTKEEIKVKEIEVENAIVNLDVAQQSLEDVKAQAENTLDAYYEDALNLLDDAYLKIYNSLNVADSIFNNYFNQNTQEGIRVKGAKDTINAALNNSEVYIGIAKNESDQSKTDIAISETKIDLSKVKDALNIIREACQTPLYKNAVLATDKTSLDNQRTYINTAQTNMSNAEQNISSTTIGNEVDIAQAEADVSTAQGNLKSAENNLSLLIASPRKEDVLLHEAQVNQAKAQVALLEKKIDDTILKSPVAGQIAKLYKREGESAIGSDIVILLIPQDPFQVEVDIPEVDIGDIKLDSKCKIVLDAFPSLELSGKIVEIEPAETIISQVVYYKIKISIESETDKIKPGMTANVDILIDSREDVLIIPQRALNYKENRAFVKIPAGNEFEEKQIEIGLSGSNGEIEVISGLQENDEVITFINDN